MIDQRGSPTDGQGNAESHPDDGRLVTGEAIKTTGNERSDTPHCTPESGALSRVLVIVKV